MWPNSHTFRSGPPRQSRHSGYVFPCLVLYMWTNTKIVQLSVRISSVNIFTYLKSANLQNQTVLTSIIHHQNRSYPGQYTTWIPPYPLVQSSTYDTMVVCSSTHTTTRQIYIANPRSRLTQSYTLKINLRTVHNFQPKSLVSLNKILIYKRYN